MLMRNVRQTPVFEAHLCTVCAIYRMSFINATLSAAGRLEPNAVTKEQANISLYSKKVKQNTTGLIIIFFIKRQKYTKVRQQKN